MNFKIAALGLLTIASSSVYAEGAVSGGTINFTGKFVNAACAIANDSSNQTVQLGEYRTASVTSEGTAKIDVPIQLNDCDPAVSSSASFSFYGTTVENNPSLLAVSSNTNEASANNVGIEMLAPDSSVIEFNTSDFKTTHQLTSGQNRLIFKAHYKALTTTDSSDGSTKLATITPGQANAIATFKIRYQ